jgi:hypothetical protein
MDSTNAGDFLAIQEAYDVLCRMAAASSAQTVFEKSSASNAQKMKASESPIRITKQHRETTTRSTTTSKKSVPRTPSGPDRNRKQSLDGTVYAWLEEIETDQPEHAWL